MAEMIPNYIDWSIDSRRNGERMVFELFSDKNIPGTVYYSVLQKNQKHKLIGEVDFLYVCSRGILCVEVKGGQAIFCKDRTWYSTNKRGEDHEIHNPFIQAKDCQYSLKKYLTDTYGRNSEQSKYLVGYAVVFPECVFTGQSNEMVTEVMYDNRYDILDFPKYLNSVFDYWERLEKERHNYTTNKLNRGQINQLNDLFRADFKVIPSMHLEMQNVNKKMLELTEEQYDVLSIADDNKRVLIYGGAGTGKTLLALEMARRYAAKNLKTLYICFNKNMASYARDTLASTDNISVFTFHNLIMPYVKEHSDFYDIEDLCKDFLNVNSKELKKYDAVIVDEGQDLFTASVIDVLDVFLNKGMEKSRWVFFMDPNQNIFNEDITYDDTYEYITELYSPVVFRLETNCRNTEQIALRTAVVSNIKPVKRLKVSGPRVVTNHYEDKKEFIKQINKEINGLLASGVSPVDIVILSRYKLENSILSGINLLCGCVLKEKKDILYEGKDVIKFFTVQSFKGLESKIVLCVDMDGFNSRNDRLINYVGMSRAKIQLYLFIPEYKIEEYRSVREKGEELL